MTIYKYPIKNKLFVKNEVFKGGYRSRHLNARRNSLIKLIKVAKRTKVNIISIKSVFEGKEFIKIIILN